MSRYDRLREEQDEVTPTDLLTEENPIEGYVDLKRFQGRALRTVEALEDAIVENAAGTALGQYFDRTGVHPLDAGIEDIYGYKAHLESKGHKDRDVQNKLSEASSMYNALVRFQLADFNPVTFVIAETDFDADAPDRPEVTVDAMASFLRWLPDPEFKAAGTFLAKTGVHSGESVNIDLSDLHLEHPRYYSLLDDLGIQLHEEVEDTPDSVYIPSDIESGDVRNGDERHSGNKRTRETIIPIGPELKYVLLQWLMMRPLLGTDEPHPLFTSVSPMNGSYRRLRPYMLYNKLILEFAVEYGIASEERDQAGVDVQYFRHFHTTQLTEGHGDHDDYLKPNLLRYIRGDRMADETLQTYTHAWSVNVRGPYRSGIFNFGLGR